MDAIFDEFVAANEIQLQTLNIHRSNWRTIFERISTRTLGTTTFTEPPFGLTESGTVVTAQNLNFLDLVVVYAHHWVFPTKERALQDLEASPNLCTAAWSMISTAHNHTLPERAAETPEQSELIQSILENLFRVALEMDVSEMGGSLGDGGSKMNCVTIDPYAPALLPFNDNPLLQAAHFLDALTGKTYTILWVNKEFMGDKETIDALTEITRSELPIMPDPSMTSYWQHHYATSQESRTFDWYLPWSRALSETLKSALSAFCKSNDFVTVLNVGCGNSRSVGDGILGDGLADLIMHVDVSGAAVCGLFKMEQISNGMQGFSVMDLASKTGLPFRKTSGDKKKIFDWAFDKGTTDGMISESLSMVSKMWANISEVTNVIVLVSHGSPDVRIPMIENFAPGWRVDQCLKIDGLETGWCYWIYVFYFDEKST